MFYALAAFFGSFLLFLVQPMAAKALLPAFGGSAAVWTSALLFFQSALFAGYAYAAFATRRLHAIVLIVAGATLALPQASPMHTLPPVLAVGAVLAATIGLPFAALSAGTTLVQRWAGTYNLYAISNAGSMLALLAYPFVVEPLFGLQAQRVLWIAGCGCYAILMAVCIARGTDAEHRSVPIRPARASLLWWIAWSGTGSGLLAATTNQLCQEVASIPFLWIVPLALYLLTFILTFQSARWRSPALWCLAAPIAIAAAAGLFVLGPQVTVAWHLPVDFFALFVCLMLCHGELAESRPPQESLGWFYLAMSAGGVAGGLFTAVIAPAVFHTYAEFPLLLSIAGGLALSRGMTSGRLLDDQSPILNRIQIFGLATAAVAPLAIFASEVPGVIEERRNFYGALRVTERAEAQGPLRTFTHGQTIHGTQWVTHQDWPTTYYSESSGVARAIIEEQRLRPAGIAVGLVGLGAGTLAHYARPRDRFTFFELNPDVEALARRHFTYLRNSAGKIDVLLGDARLQLAAHTSRFDVLVVDAFSSDSIPVHLLTQEAAQVYAAHVKPEGVIMLHISNRTLDLQPVTRGLARVLNRRYEVMLSGDQPSVGGSSATWVRLSPGAYEGEAGILWTDAYSSLWPILIPYTAPRKIR